jgi:hypothetical protein
MAASMDIPMHDIRPLLEVQEHSIVWFLVLVGLILVIVSLSVKQIRSRKKSKETDERKMRYDYLTHIDVTDPKAAAYEIGKQGAFFAQDSEQIRGAYLALFKRLEPYKYAPKVEPMNEECLALYKAYCQMIIA